MAGPLRAVTYATLLLLILAPLAPGGSVAQEPPAPARNPVVPAPEYRSAVEAGTRHPSGAPGERYWRAWTDYRLRARLFPEEKELRGSARILYRNRSPDTLRVLFLHLHQNLHAPGTVRNEPQEVTGGVRLERLAVDGSPLEATDDPDATGYGVRATILRARPPDPVAPGATAEIEAEWSFRIPRSGAGRMGWDSDDLVFLGYWYPRMAVHDDVGGWHAMPYLGRGEFYDGFGSYDVAITAPEGWVLRATGTLRNAGEVLPDPVRERLRRAAESDTVVHVLGADEFGAGSATLDVPGDTLTWRFRADSVRDVAVSATRRSLWDAARAPVGDRNGDGETDYARVEALYRPSAPRWSETWRYARHALSFHSRYTGTPYPWPHMTAVEGGGVIGGGMEYPMMTLMGDYEARGDSALYYVTAHELAHMWVPMLVSTDEKRYAWMDEGTTTFHENRAREEFFAGRDADAADLEDYLETAREEHEVPVMRWMDYQYPEAGNVPNYDKPAIVLLALGGLLGEETLREALATFLREWRFRHPYPWDFFRTVERVSGRDLGWFWRSWYYETWVLDQAIADVRREDGTLTVTVENRGLVPMPVRLRVVPPDGYAITREVPVEAWLGGERRVEVEVSVPPGRLRVEIDPDAAFPDVDRSNNSRIVEGR